MCILVQINVYHFCSHTQRVTVPSVNPQCNKELFGRDYLMGEWCPRCRLVVPAESEFRVLISANRWTGFMAPYRYEEFAEGVPCEGYTGKVTRTIKLDPEEFKHPKTKEQLWDGRVEYQTRMLDFRKYQERERYFKLQELEEQQEPPVSDLKRTYFMEENVGNDPEWNLCRALFYNLEQDEIPEGKELCGICHRELKTDDEDARCNSGFLIVVLPCDHYFGQDCIGQWLGDPKTPTCPECRHRYNIMYEVSNEGLGIRWPPGFEEQRLVDFSLESDVRWLYLRLVLIYFLKMGFIAVLFAPFPVSAYYFIHLKAFLTRIQWASWTNLWMFTFGAVLFYCSFIQLVQLTPVFSPREQIVQNRFAIFSAVGNIIELVVAKVTGVQGFPLWIYGGLSWVLLAVMIYNFRPTFRLPV